MHIDRMQCLNAAFYALFLERCHGRVGRNAGKKAAECCRIFGFYSRSRRFIFMLWVRAAI